LYIVPLNLAVSFREQVCWMCSPNCTAYALCQAYGRYWLNSTQLYYNIFAAE